MNIIEDKVSFHDATLVGVRRDKDRLIFALEDVSVGDSQNSINATASNIESITRDGLQTNNIEMETSDGEVIQLCAKDDTITLVVTWHKHGPHSRHTHTYRMAGKRISLDIDRI